MFTAEQVHQDFLSAQDRLVAEAKSLIDNPRIDAMKRAERLNRLGFNSSKDAKLAEEMAQKSVKANDLLSLVAYFRTYYPANKFITEEEVKKLCDKYGLVLGSASSYIGDVPEKNIAQMEAFKLRKEDFIEQRDSLSFVARELERSLRFYNPFVTDWLGQFGERKTVPVSFGMDYSGEEPGKSTEKPAFKICAPEKEFNMARLTVADGYKLVVDDPIVLQPVKGGYLIVTAWGPEASDEIVVNQKMN